MASYLINHRYQMMIRQINHHQRGSKITMKFIIILAMLALDWQILEQDYMLKELRLSTMMFI